MIIVKLVGGLGNQMFQYATARALAERHRCELKLDTSWFRKPGSDTRRSYGLRVFNTVKAQATKREINAVKHRSGNKLDRILRSHFRGFFPLRKSYFFEESALHFSPEVLKLTDNSYLEGFFQYLAYFQSIEKILQDEFQFIKQPNKKNKLILDKIEIQNSVSVHIRRKDYISNKNYRSYFAHPSRLYYKKAMEMINRKVPSPDFYIFSDDIPWVKKHFKNNHNMHFISHNKGKNDFEDMRLMQSCKHNITANSSFSWWAAWLNQNPHKIVITPRKWYQDKLAEMTGKFPPNWTKL